MAGSEIPDHHAVSAVRTDLRNRSWATDLSTAKYWTDPEKFYVLSATLRNLFGSHTAA